MFGRRAKEPTIAELMDRELVRQDEANAARDRLRTEAIAALQAHTPVKPLYRIRQNNYGYYNIERRRSVCRGYELAMFGRLDYSADYYYSLSREIVEIYEAMRNQDVMSERHNKPLQFNTQDQAVSYLERMINPPGHVYFDQEGTRIDFVEPESDE